MKNDPMHANPLARAVELSRARGPSPEAIARMRTALPLPGGPLGPGAMNMNTWLVRLVAGTAVVGAVVAGGLAVRHGGAPSAPFNAPAATYVAQARATVPAPPVETAIPTIAIEDLPHAVPRSAETIAQPGGPPRAATQSSGVAQKDEAALVLRAQSALASNPSLALSLAERHASEFPHGELSQERELVAIEALAKLGRSDDAKARATRFLADHPRTPYRLRLTRAVDGTK